MATVIIVSAAVSMFGWIMFGIGFYIGYKSSVSNRLNRENTLKQSKF